MGHIRLFLFLDGQNALGSKVPDVVNRHATKKNFLGSEESSVVVSPLSEVGPSPLGSYHALRTQTLPMRSEAHRPVRNDPEDQLFVTGRLEGFVPEPISVLARQKE
eukprot:scaffold3924_cov109-Cylindrotheca_fusiformis.AAC.5